MTALNLDRGGEPDFRGLTGPEGYVLVLGDHRGSSLNGRSFGTMLVGKQYLRAIGVFWTMNEGPVWKGL